MTVVAVTGAAGVLGARLLERLDADPAITRIVAIDLQPPQVAPGKLKFIESDISGPVRSGLEKYKVTKAVHLAFVPEAGAEAAAAQQRLVAGTGSFLTACLAAQTVETVVILSSALVYGAHPDNPERLAEDAALRPNDLLQARQLVAMEALAAATRARYPAFRVQVVRAATVVGPALSDPFLHFLRETPLSTGAADVVLQFVHAGDVVAALQTLLQCDVNGVYNLAADGTIGLADVLRHVGARARALPPALAWRLLKFGGKARLTDVPAGYLAYMQSSWCVDNRKLKRDCGFSCRYDAAEALAHDTRISPV